MTLHQLAVDQAVLLHCASLVVLESSEAENVRSEVTDVTATVKYISKSVFLAPKWGGGVLSMENLDLGYVHEARANILDWLKNFQYFCSVYAENF